MKNILLLGSGISVTPLCDYLNERGYFTAKSLSSFLCTQRQQITEISSNAVKEKDNSAEKEINRDIGIAAGSLVCAGAGYIISPFLGVVSLIGNVYLTIPSVKIAYASLMEKRTVNIDTLTVITMGIGLGMHYYVWCSIANILYVTKARFNLVDTKNNDRTFDLTCCR